jgi:voltage-gated potassium channel
MLPGRSLGDLPAVRLVARISNAGTALPEAGDVFGEVDWSPGQGDVTILMDRVVEPEASPPWAAPATGRPAGRNRSKRDAGARRFAMTRQQSRHGRRRTRLPLPTASRLRRFIDDVLTETYFVAGVGVLAALWLVFAGGLFLAERGVAGSPIGSYADALYWGVAAFSTAGIADTPLSGAAKLVGAVWIVIGSVVFFGMIVATVTGYFMRPVQRPARRIIETIEFNLERLEDLTAEELGLLKDTVDALILHMERARNGQPADAGS